MFARQFVARILGLTLSILFSLAFAGQSVSPARSIAAASPEWAAASSATPLAVNPSAPSTVSASIARLGPQPFVTLFCQFPDVEIDESLRAYYEELLGDAAPGMADYWNEVSYGQISLAGSRVAGWYQLPHSSGDYKLRPTDEATLMQLAEECTTAAEHHIFFPDFAGINLVFNLCPGTGYGGRSLLTLDGQEKVYGVTWLCRNRSSWQSTVVHEMGHALGLSHSSDGSSKVYSNPWDAMSDCDFCQNRGIHGRIRQHPIAYQKDRLGWIPDVWKFMATPGSSAQLTLEQLAQPQTSNYLLAVIPLPGQEGRFYTVEARRRVGYDKNLPMDAVVIHLIDPESNPAAIVVSHEPVEGVLVNTAWMPGMVFTDAEHGVTVEVDAETATGFVVTISVLPAS